MKNQIVDLLLVEDREEDAELAIMALKDNGLLNGVVWVKDGQEALDFLFSKNQYTGRQNLPRPKLILLDLKMPKVSGIQVLKEIREHEFTKTMPVVVMTTSREDRDRIEAYNLGVNSYVVKPLEFENFTQSVREIGLYWLLLNEPPIT